MRVQANSGIIRETKIREFFHTCLDTVNNYFYPELPRDVLNVCAAIILLSPSG